MEESVFNPSQQAIDLDSRIVVALERVSEAFRVLLWNEAKVAPLSPIQIQLLVFLLFHRTQLATVSYLAKEFHLTKATISEAVKNLLAKQYVEKVEGTDLRSFTLRLTEKGAEATASLSLFANVLKQPLGQLSADQKNHLHDALLAFIAQLQQAGIITMQRMCFTCSMYSKREGAHYCALMQAPLQSNQLQTDCPDHAQ